MLIRNRSLLALVFGMLLCGQVTLVAAADSPFRDAIDKTSQYMVKIYGGSIGRSAGYGTGLLVSDDGEIVTSSGVYLSGGNIKVSLADGSVHFAHVLRRNRDLHLAILKIDAKTPNFAKIPENCPARRGDWVLCVSNAFKVADGAEDLSVNLGVVSLRTKLDTQRGASDVDYSGDVLLIDAITSNPGAAGGAVVLPDGKIAGIIGKILEGKNTGTRLNYAVPSDQVHAFLVGKPIEPATPVASKDPPELGIRLFAFSGIRGPAYVDRVKTGSPADKAGLKSDDLIVSLGGQSVKTVRDYQAILKTLPSDKPVSVNIKRRTQLLQLELKPAAE